MSSDPLLQPFKLKERYRAYHVERAKAALR